MRRIGLCIGINDYPGTGSDLSGCVNDANDWADALRGRGFDDVTVMLDGEATLRGMADAMTAAVNSAEAGDLVVIQYSGHGTWQADENGDEPDQRDEALCPHDFSENGPLLDDTLFDIFSSARDGAKVVFLSDSCHSGSVASIALPMGGGPASGTVRFLPPGPFLSGTALDRARKAEKKPAKGMSRTTALLISGCDDPEYSYDANFGGRFNGAFTRAALDTLPKLAHDATYGDWHTAIRTVLPSDQYPQSPQLMISDDQREWTVLG